MCIDKNDLKKLVDSVSDLQESINRVEYGLGTANESLSKINGRVKDVENDCLQFKLYRAGRSVDCPTLPVLEDLAKNVKKNAEHITELQKNEASTKAVKKELRWWLGGISTLVSAIYLIEKFIQ